MGRKPAPSFAPFPCMIRAGKHALFGRPGSFLEHNRQDSLLSPSSALASSADLYFIRQVSLPAAPCHLDPSSHLVEVASSLVSFFFLTRFTSSCNIAMKSDDFQAWAMSFPASARYFLSHSTHCLISELKKH